MKQQQRRRRVERWTRPSKEQQGSGLERGSHRRRRFLYHTAGSGSIASKWTVALPWRIDGGHDGPTLTILIYSRSVLCPDGLSDDVRKITPAET